MLQNNTKFNREWEPQRNSARWAPSDGTWAELCWDTRGTYWGTCEQGFYVLPAEELYSFRACFVLSSYCLRKEIISLVLCCRIMFSSNKRKAWEKKLWGAGVQGYVEDDWEGYPTQPREMQQAQTNISFGLERVIVTQWKGHQTLSGGLDYTSSVCIAAKCCCCFTVYFLGSSLTPLFPVSKSDNLIWLLGLSWCPDCPCTEQSLTVLPQQTRVICALLKVWIHLW